MRVMRPLIHCQIRPPGSELSKCTKPVVKTKGSGKSQRGGNGQHAERSDRVGSTGRRGYILAMGGHQELGSEIHQTKC